jgi:hypothetical protein
LISTIYVCIPLHNSVDKKFNTRSQHVFSNMSLLPNAFIKPGHFGWSVWLTHSLLIHQFDAVSLLTCHTSQGGLSLAVQFDRIAVSTRLTSRNNQGQSHHLDNHTAKNLSSKHPHNLLI